MGVKRRVNWISQQRVDVPDMRALESAVSNDFDELIKSFVTGTTQGYILRGFEFSMAGAIGGAASGLQLIVDPGAVFHVSSSQSGTFYLVPSGTPVQQLNSATNTIIDGAFTPSAINYIGLEYERFIDDTTSSQVYIWNPTTNNETTKNAPRAQILRYRIKITTSTFATNVLPIATVTTDSGNNVISITDARWMLFRLGTGGASPNPFYVYPWTAQPEGRTENPSTSSSNSINPFHGGDKMLMTLKDWMNAMMTAIQEIKGTVYWYGPGTAGSIESLRQDLGNTVTTGKGTISHSDTVAGRINWDEDIFMKVVGSRLAYKIIANPSSTDITLSDNQVAYLNLVRNVEVSPNLVWVNSSAIIQSVGSIAWTGSLQAGDFLKLGAENDAGYYQILSINSLSQVTLTIPYTGASTGAGGAKSKYTFGSYQTSPAPSTNRHIHIANRDAMPLGQDVWWFLLRADNGGVIPRVYVRFLGSELEQGETEEIDDGVPRQLLQYIGSPLESARFPQYVFTFSGPSLPEITDLKVGTAATISSNQYFFIHSAADSRNYYVWFNKDGTGVDPTPLAGYTGIEVPISTGQTANQVAIALAAELSTIDYHNDFTAVVRPIPNTDTVRVTNNSSGITAAASNFNVGAPFTITVIQIGTGVGNYVINDGDSLTLAIKKLDIAYGQILLSLDSPSYDETVDIVTSGATPPTSLNGPISPSTNIALPNNTRMGNITQYYTVGKGSLMVFLNGQYLRLGIDWSEFGGVGTASNAITILQSLVVGDVIEFRIGAGGAGSGGGGGGIGPAGPPGPPGANAAGGPVAIDTKTSNYSVLSTDCFLKADCTSGAITFGLPAAASVVGRIFYFKKIDSTANAMTLQGNLSELIDLSNTLSTIVQNEAFSIISDGTRYLIF